MNLSRRTLIASAAIVGAAAAPAFAAVRGQGGTRAQARALREVERYIEQHRADWGLPGVTFSAVDREGYTGYGTSGWAVADAVPLTTDHMFQVGSISKMMVALTLHSMAEEGKLSLDARLLDLMPELRINGAGAETITLQQVLDHRSGLPGNGPTFPEGGLTLAAAPDARWDYSNIGYDLLGYVIRRYDGRLHTDALQARVLQPLGMTHTRPEFRNRDRALMAQGYEPLYNDRPAFRPGPMAPSAYQDSDRAAGSVTSTPGDMALFLRFLLGMTEGRGGGVLSDEGARRFITHTVVVEDDEFWGPGGRYGNGIAHLIKDGRTYLHHTGGYFWGCSSLHVDAEAGVAAYASTNISTRLDYRPRDITLHACRLLKSARDGSPTPDAPPTRAVVENAGRYVGTFVAANGDRFEARADGDQLKLRYDGRENELQAVPGAGNRFATREQAFAVSGLSFELENDRAVRAWADEVEYLADPSRGYAPPPSAELAPLTGRYDGQGGGGGGGGSMRVTARGNELRLGSNVLTPLGDNEWRQGPEGSPGRVRFTTFLAGTPMQIVVNGTTYTRRFS